MPTIRRELSAAAVAARVVGRTWEGLGLRGLLVRSRILLLGSQGAIDGTLERWARWPRQRSEGIYSQEQPTPVWGVFDLLLFVIFTIVLF